MARVFPATAAELTELETISGRLFILGRDVVATLTISTLQYDVIPRHKVIFDFRLPISNLKSASCRLVFPIGNRQLEIGN